MSPTFPIHENVSVPGTAQTPHEAFAALASRTNPFGAALAAVPRLSLAVELGSTLFAVAPPDEFRRVRMFAQTSELLNNAGVYPLSLISCAIRGCYSVDGHEPEERIRQQMVLDVEAFGKDAGALGVNV